MKAQTFEFDTFRPSSKSSLRREKSKHDNGEWVDGVAYTSLGIVMVYAEKDYASFRAYVGGKLIDGVVHGPAVSLSPSRLSKMAGDFAATVKARCRVKA